MISVQQQDFNFSDEYHKLMQNNTTDGAVVCFVGLVRDFNQGNRVESLLIEHYPAMTEKALSEIVLTAKKKWSLGKVKVIHRFGELALGEQIVFVGVTSQHRESAFEANQFIMDYLKNRAPFWKKELTSHGERWVDAEAKDKQAELKWE
ncbi:molybdopterin synthase catalytic subunit MoaE [Flocculibacter collagenilyticus]|uniref:molybdopterin synthase catalytic subunit MoaE n=1 Tax=Flocculibacter collagenilyticus TaxID=2744479 RepID=UPI0018F3BF5E|nr:molybdopterin synthase catalytic subunit MoaE [Flocculibacter collagenilyticus]